MFTDIVESTHLKQRLGDTRAVALFEQHDAAIRSLLSEYFGAKELGVAGDSFTLSFLDAADALLFSLRLHAALEKIGAEDGVELRLRIGIHIGDLLVDESLQSGRPIAGMALDVCARIMSLGDGGQTLLSRLAFDESRRALSQPASLSMGAYEWLSHGMYQLKGAEEPLEICEVGLPGQAPLKAPAHAEKARRLSTPDGELVLGWRPAVGRDVPGTSWKLERPLGEGGFGEVWLGRHTVLKERRVFKFCFRADRVRSLKREVTLFRVLRESAGQHPHIVNVHDVYLNEPPFYVAMDFVEGNAFSTWIASHGGFENVPMESCVEIVAQVADALQAAHEAGVLHRDVKPGNILLSGTVEAPQAKLSDFGIGQVLSIEVLGGVTAHGLTQTLVGSSSASGTQMYLAPEVVRGQPSTPQSDIYALGVVLYQAYVGDFQQPLTTDWEEAIHDTQIREDLRKCFASDPSKRFASAERLAESLRAIPERRAAAAARREEVAAAERRAFRAGVLRTVFGALAAIALFIGLALFAWAKANQASKSATVAENARRRADSLLEHERQLRAETLFENGKSPLALAYLAGVVRQNPNQVSAAERLVYGLLQRPLAWPVTTTLPHESYIDDLAFTTDGTGLIVLTAKTMQLWDIATGKKRFPSLPVGGSQITLSRNGTHAVVAGDAAQLIDLETFKVVQRWERRPGSSVDGERFVDFHPKGAAVAVLDGSDELTLRDPVSGQQIGAPLRTGAPLVRALFSPDGKSLAVGDLTGRLWLWDFPAQEKPRWRALLPGRIRSMAWNQASSRIAVGAENGSFRLLDVEKELSLPPTGSDWGAVVYDVAFSPDDRELCGVTQNHGVYLRSVESGEVTGHIEGDGYAVLQAQYTADGSMLVVRTGEGLVKFYDAKTRRQLMDPLEFNAFPRTIQLSPDGASLAIGGADGNAQVWRIDARSIKPLRVHNQGRAALAQFQGGGKQLLTSGTDGHIRLVNLEDSKGRKVIADLSKPVKTFAAAEGTIVAITEGDTTWRLNRLPDGNWTEPQQLVPARDVRFSSDGSHFILQRVDNTVQLFETASGKAISDPVGTKVTDAVICRGGRDLVWLEGDTRIRRLDVATRKISDTPIAHKASIGRLSVSPSGNWLASISEDVAALWNLQSDAPPKYLPHGNTVTTFEFSADDQWAVATSGHRAAHVWRLPEGIRMPESLMGGGHLVSQARFVPGDSRRVWTVDYQAIRFWDAPGSLPLSDPLISREQTRGVVASRGGERMVILRRLQPDFYVFETPSFTTPSPSWLADWAEAVGGYELGKDGTPVPVPLERRLAWRQSATQQTGDDNYSRALRWWLTDSRKRSCSPFSLLPADEEEDLGRPKVPPRDPNATAAQIDLSPYYSALLDQDPSTFVPTDTLEELPPGLHVWKGIAYDVRGIVQLGLKGTNMNTMPRRVDGIPVKQKARALHLVGAARNVNPNSKGEEAMHLVVRYKNGDVINHPFRLGIDLGDWWLDVLAAEENLVWVGSNPSARKVGNDIGVYHMKWDNPRPEEPIEFVDFVSLDRGGAPFILALTAEP